MAENQERDQAEIDRQILAMREGGASWNEIEVRFSLTRQQARHCYQRALRERRRAERRK